MRSTLRTSLCATLILLTAGLASCDRGTSSSGGKKPVIGVSFDTLQTEYWVASRDAIEKEIKARNAEMMLAVADNVEITKKTV